MVKRTMRLLMLASLLPMSFVHAEGLQDNGVELGMVNPAPPRIKPCQGVTFLLTISAKHDVSHANWTKLTKKLSRLVRINGQDYVNPLADSTSLNHACKFELLWAQPSGGEAPLLSAQTVLVSALCQVDAKAQSCLFLEPGQYKIDFILDESVVGSTVHVDSPTPSEREIIRGLSTQEMLLFLYDPSDRKYATPKNIATLEAMIPMSSNYADWLSLTVGVAKSLRVDRPLWNELTDDQKVQELNERMVHLMPSLELEPTSKLTGLAYYELMQATSQLARLVHNQAEKAKIVMVRDKAIQKLREARLVPKEQSVVK